MDKFFMTKTTDQVTSEWLFYALSDLQSAEQSNINHQICFHSQQTAEKSLKAVLAWEKQVIPKTHSIWNLTNVVIKAAPNLPNRESLLDDARFLDQFYVPSRYPDALPGSLPEGLPTADDAQKSLELAKDFYQFLRFPKTSPPKSSKPAANPPPDSIDIIKLKD